MENIGMYRVATLDRVGGKGPLCGSVGSETLIKPAM